MQTDVKLLSQLYLVIRSEVTVRVIADSANLQKRIIFFGDSICFGQGVSIHRGWVTRLAARLDKISNDLDDAVVVVNASVNGNTTRLALERMPYDVQSHGVDILIVQFGMNDCNYWQSDHGIPRVSPEAFKANLKEIALRGFIFGARHIVFLTNHPTLRISEKMPNANLSYQESNAAYNDIIRSTAEELSERVALIDIEKIFSDRTKIDEIPLCELLLPDGLHLSEQGHNIYYTSVESTLCAMVRHILGNR